MCCTSRECKSHLDDLILALAGLLLLAPVWLFPFFPTQDGPAHLGNAAALLHYNDGELPRLREYYVLQTTLLPNWITHLALAALLVVAPPLLAEKIFLTGFVLLFVFAARYALRALPGRAGFLALLCGALLYNLTLHKGFYNFNLSLAFYFLFVGYWLAHAKNLRAREMLVLLGLSLLLYLSHLVSLVMAFIGVALLAVIFFIADARGLAARRALRLALERGAPLAVIFLPATLLALRFVFRNPENAASISLARVRDLRTLVALDALVTFPQFDMQLATTIAVLFGLVLLYFLLRVWRGWNRYDGLLLVGAVYVGLYIVAPNSLAGGSFVGQRLALYPLFALGLWFGTRAWGNLPKRLVQCAAGLILLAVVVTRLMLFQQVSPLLTDYTSAAQALAPNTTLVAFVFDDGEVMPRLTRELGRDRAFAHAADYLAAERSVVNLANYEAVTDYFPLMYRTWRGDGPKAAGGKVKLKDLPRVSNIDYVYLWGARTPLAQAELSAPVIQVLDTAYEIVFVTPLGYGTLFHRKATAP